MKKRLIFLVLMLFCLFISSCQNYPVITGNAVREPLRSPDFMNFISNLFGMTSYRTSPSTPDNFPRLAIVMHPCVSAESDIESLSKYDLLVLHKYYTQTTGTCNQALLANIREKNPNAKIFVHIPQSYVLYPEREDWPACLDYPSIPTDCYPRKDDILYPLLKDVIFHGQPENVWLLTDTNGNSIIDLEMGTPIDITQFCPPDSSSSSDLDWNHQNIKYTKENIISSGVWDGIFWDSVYNDISWRNSFIPSPIDLNHDNISDGPSWLNAQWKTGVNNFYSLARQELGNDIFMIGNGYHDQYSYGNGMMIEVFASKSWQYQIDTIKSWEENGVSPNYNIIVEQFTPSNNYKSRRFVLGSTLLTNAYYEMADNAYYSYWWLDEFSVNYTSGQAITPTSINNYAGKHYLGNSINTAFTIPSLNNIWRRDFQNGIVLVNPNTTSATITLEKTYRKILGTQDSIINNGSIVTKITLQANDAIILLNPLSCGDSYCTSGETCTTCPSDCGACINTTIPPNTTIPIIPTINDTEIPENITEINLTINFSIPCQDECTSNNKECLNNISYHLCNNYDQDSCSEWSSAINCETNYTCENGNCIAQQQTQMPLFKQDLRTRGFLLILMGLLLLVIASSINLTKRYRN